jgi:transcription termination factor NusB
MKEEMEKAKTKELSLEELSKEIVWPSRHLSRSIAMQSLYEWDFYEQKVDLKEIVERNLKEFGPGLDGAFVWELVFGSCKTLERD